MSDYNRRLVTLEPHNAGDLVVEVVRAYLHSANPSVMIKRVSEGLALYTAERELSARRAHQVEPAERAILDDLRTKLDALREQVLQLERHHYGM